MCAHGSSAQSERAAVAAREDEHLLIKIKTRRGKWGAAAAATKREMCYCKQTCVFYDAAVFWLPFLTGLLHRRLAIGNGLNLGYLLLFVLGQ